MIGVLGGTFDPVHFGHLRPALDCLQSLGLDEVRFIPLKVAVHRAQPRAPAELRLAMVQAAVAAASGLEADGRELARDGASYSYDTLHSVRREIGPTEPMCLLVGADAFNGFLSWHRPADILSLAHLVVMQRPGSPDPEDPVLCDLVAERGCDDAAELHRLPGGRILHKRVTQLGVSSSQIRALIADGRSARYLLPDPVLEIIERDGLYRGSIGHSGAPPGAPDFPTPGAARPAQPQAEEKACSWNN
jgi:nicotinate-nucleotide adenylyltransferase